MTLVATLLLTFAILLAIIGAMAIGVMNGRQPIRGSCGGLNGAGCELCSGKCSGESRQ